MSSKCPASSKCCGMPHWAVLQVLCGWGPRHRVQICAKLRLGLLTDRPGWRYFQTGGGLLVDVGVRAASCSIVYGPGNELF